MTCGCFGAKSAKKRRSSNVAGEIDGQMFSYFNYAFHDHLCVLNIVNKFVLMVLLSTVINWQYVDLQSSSIAVYIHLYYFVVQVIPLIMLGNFLIQN